MEWHWKLSVSDNIMMNRINNTLHLTKNLLLCEWADRRVIMGFLTGMAVPFWWLRDFLDYVISTGEPVNILEAFPVIEHYSGSMLFLVLGWFLVISDAPFINGNTYYSLYRTKRRSWNCAIIFYILMQAALYTAAAALPAVLVSLPYGYVGNMWSSPVYALSQDFGMRLGETYHIDFLQVDLMRRMNVPQAFAATILCFFLYLAVMGMILYTFSLLPGGIWGIVVTFIVHIGGRGLGKLAPIRYAHPANFIDREGVHLMKAIVPILLIMATLLLLQSIFIKETDFKARAQGENL